MCYSISVKISKKEWSETLKIYQDLTGSEIEDLMTDGIDPIYFTNVYKDNHPPIPVITQEDPDQIQHFRWGVIPPSAKYIYNDKGELVHPWSRPNFYHTTANARVENLDSSKTWKRLFRDQRCLVIASGFYESYHMPKRKVTYPHYISLKSNPVFAFGGLYDRWIDTETNETIDSCAIISTRPNSMMEKIHNSPNTFDGPRSPVIILPNQWKEWLTGNFSYEKIQEFAKPFPSDQMKAVPVRQGLMKRDVNANVASVMEPIDFPELPGDWTRYGDSFEPQTSLF